MTIFIDGHPYHYEVQALCMLFLMGEEITLVREVPDQMPQRYIYTGVRDQGGIRILTVRLEINHQKGEEKASIPLSCEDLDHESERIFGRLLYGLLSPLTGIIPQWGILTGVRPVKLFAARLGEGEAPESVAHYFERELLVSPEKCSLALETALTQAPFLHPENKKDVALYIAIPFCPTRCRYCSFVSHSIQGAAKLVEPYLDILGEELRELGDRVRRLGIRITSVYIGGGTPTSLSAPQLSRLMGALKGSFELEGLEEFTVEAGRPDTITPEKLSVLREAGVGRLSINPQSLQDEVLRLAQRPHTAQDVLEKYAMAKEYGFETLNMDLIAGLEGDTPEGFEDSLRRVLALRPQNITVHTLSVKRSAMLGKERTAVLAGEGAAEMVTLSGKLLREAGYRPYYLYRQKNTVQNLENTGWSLPGHESPYNIRIMDESHSILGAGAGAVTKLCDGTKITRIFNYKYPYEYIERYPLLKERHDGIDAFFRNLASLLGE